MLSPLQGLLVYATTETVATALAAAAIAAAASQPVLRCAHGNETTV